LVEKIKVEKIARLFFMPREISLRLGKPLLHTRPGTAAAEAYFFTSFTAGLKACSTREEHFQIVT
jgi:hypothetical protein